MGLGEEGGDNKTLHLKCQGLTKLLCSCPTSEKKQFATVPQSYIFCEYADFFEHKKLHKYNVNK